VPSRYSESVDALDESSSFERLINIQSYSDEELTTLAAQLAEEEREVSMRRRLLHAEMDILRAETVRRLREKNKTDGGLVLNGDIAALTDILSGRRQTGDPKGEE
jgi:FKBP-type peptidyl-prolyl cis-trans isomerase (trigger factor)